MNVAPASRAMALASMVLPVPATCEWWLNGAGVRTHGSANGTQLDSSRWRPVRSTQPDSIRFDTPRSSCMVDISIALAS